MTAYPMIKYPRTPHIEGSRLQPGDEDMTQIPYEDIAGLPLVVEEKIDGANAAVSFDADGTLLLQSRGHYLTGGYREKHFNLMKQWARVHEDAFRRVLGDRYILYGEWMYAKHSVFYDALPGYFLEFDVLDRSTDAFLDTPSRRALLSGAPVASVPVLYTGVLRDLDALKRLLGPSRYIRPGHIERLRRWCLQNGQDADARARETDPSTQMEGLYIKVERDGCVKRRMKFVRASFLQCVQESGTHWLERPIVPNQLARGMDSLFDPAPPHDQ